MFYLIATVQGEAHLLSFHRLSSAITADTRRNGGGPERLLGNLKRVCLFLLILAVAGASSPCSAQDVTFDMKSVSTKAATKFKKQFFLRKESLEHYFAATKFSTLFSGNIDVEVSDGPPFSEALLFAWDGRRGHMYFPAARAKDGTGAILHELAHVHAPNQARFLAEGYPAYLEEKMGNIEAYPTRGDAIECGIGKYNRAYKSALQSVKLPLFDGVATQRGVFLGDNIGLESAFPTTDVGVGHRRAYSYLVSASFVKFLVERYGLDKFKALYEATPLTPGLATQADAHRYQAAFFGKSVADLQTDWLGWLKDKQKSCP